MASFHRRIRLPASPSVTSTEKIFHHSISGILSVTTAYGPQTDEDIPAWASPPKKHFPTFPSSVPIRVICG